MTEAKKQSQLERFKETAKQVETDDSEEHFDRTLRKVVKAPHKPRPDESKADK